MQQFEARNPVTIDASDVSVGDMQRFDAEAQGVDLSGPDVGPVRERAISAGGTVRDRTRDSADRIQSRLISPTVRAADGFESAVDDQLPDRTVGGTVADGTSRLSDFLLPSSGTLDSAERITGPVDDFGQTVSDRTFGVAERRAEEEEEGRQAMAGPTTSADPVDALSGFGVEQSSVFRGFRDVTESGFGLPQTAVDSARAAPDATDAIQDRIRDEGLARGGVGLGTAATIGAGGLAADAARGAAEDPGRAIGNVGLGTITGSAAARGLERGATAARVRLEGLRGPDIDARDTTRQPETVAAGDQPTFETPGGAPSAQAADEFRTRSREQPDELQQAAGSDQVTLRTESDRLPSDMTAQTGDFELPGLFVSGDFPPLRFDQTRSGGFDLRAPRLFGTPERASAFETRSRRTLEGLKRTNLSGTILDKSAR